MEHNPCPAGPLLLSAWNLTTAGDVISFPNNSSPASPADVLQTLQRFQTTPQALPHPSATLQRPELSKHLLGKEQVTNSNIISCVCRLLFPPGSPQGLLSPPLFPSLLFVVQECVPLPPCQRLVMCDFSSDKTFWQLLGSVNAPLSAALSTEHFWWSCPRAYSGCLFLLLQLSHLHCVRIHFSPPLTPFCSQGFSFLPGYRAQKYKRIL